MAHADEIDERLLRRKDTLILLQALNTKQMADEIGFPDQDGSSSSSEESGSQSSDSSSKSLSSDQSVVETKSEKSARKMTKFKD